MSRRTIAFLLIAFGLLAIVGIGLWLWWPYRKKAVTPVPLPTVQPPAYADDMASTTSPLVNTPIPVPAYDRTEIALNERNLQDLLRRKALDFTARVGTYSNADEFGGIKQVYVDATPELRTYLETQRTQLAKDHPLRGPMWGQTARALSVRFLTLPPLAGKTSVDLVVQVQLVAGPDEQTAKTYREAKISYTLTNNAWMASRIVWSDLQI